MDADSWLRQSHTLLLTADAHGNSALISIIVVIILILINGFFSATEMAIITLNDNKVRKLAENGNRTYKKILHFIENPGRFLATIQVGVTFAGFLSSAFAGTQFGDMLYFAIDPQQQIPALRTVALVLVTLILSYFSLVLGELVPKHIAMKYPEQVAKQGVNFIRGFGFIVRPFTIFLTFSTNLVLKIFGIDPDANEKNVTEEEIRMMIDVSSSSGQIESSESQMIQNIFEFNDKAVTEIMVHRKNISGISTSATFDEVITISKEEGYTRLPVYEDNIDQIVGILNVKDLLYFISKYDRGEFDITKIMREPVFVPETKNIDDLFKELQLAHEAMAIVIDEYGGVAGLVTLEDVLEEIVGNIQDEYDDEVPEFTENEDGSFVIDGMTYLDDMVKGIPDFYFNDEDADYETIAGLVLHQLDRIPDEDEQPEINYRNYKFKVLEMDDKRIAKILMNIEESKPKSHGNDKGHKDGEEYNEQDYEEENNKKSERWPNAEDKD